MSDQERRDEAEAYADAYNASLQAKGLPTYPGWDRLTAEQKIIAVASVFSGGTVGGAAQGTAIVLLYVNQDAARSWLKRATRAPSIRWPRW